MTLTLTLRRADQAAFERFLAAVENRHSPLFRHFLSQRQLADRFGPSSRTYDVVLGWLLSRGFRLVQGSANRLTITVSGSRSQVERAFDVRIGDYATAGGGHLYANQDDPAIPVRLARHVESVAGLSNIGQPAVKAPRIDAFNRVKCQLLYVLLMPIYYDDGVGWYQQTYAADWNRFIAFLREQGCAGAYPAAGHVARHFALEPRGTIDGSGQKIGLLEFAGVNVADVSDFLNLVGPSAEINNFSVVNVGGGAGAPSGTSESEALLDSDIALTTAPGAKVVVYDGPVTASYEQMFNAMIGDHDTVISNSWSSCEDQISEAEAQSIDQILASAAASGISTLNGAGDDGSTCLDGAANTISVPADSPNATAIGGTSPAVGVNGIYGRETWWNGSAGAPPTGQGGFGISRYFGRPSYQQAVSGASMRSIPDVSLAADPATDPYSICQGDAGGCPNGLAYGGTSAATPLMAGFVALMNQSVGHNLGALNQLMYPLAGTMAFHSAAGMGSDFAHVGLGSPNIVQLELRLAGSSPGSPSAATSFVEDANGGQSPADGTTKDSIVVFVSDDAGHAISGHHVTLTASPGTSSTITPNGAVVTDVNDGAAVFTVTDATVEPVTYTATDTDTGTVLGSTTVQFVPPTATGASINATPSTVANDGTSKATITVYLQNGLAQPAAGKTVTLAQQGGATITPSTSVVTDANGDATFTATDTNTESVTFTAVDATDGNLPVPGSTEVTFQPASTTPCPDGSPMMTAGYTASPFATGLPINQQDITTFNAGLFFTFPKCLAPDYPVFDASGNMYTPDATNGAIYEFGAGGGAASGATQLPNTTFAPGDQLGGLAFGKDGSLYAGLANTNGDFHKSRIVQVDPATGATLRTIATAAQGLQACPAFLASDPVSGDLFVGDDCKGGGGIPSEKIVRISNPASGTPTVSTYADLSGPYPGGYPDELAFSPDGTLYAAVSSYSCSTASNLVNVGVPSSGPASPTTVASLPGGAAESLAIGAVNGSGHGQTFYTNTCDGIVKVDATGPTITSIAAGGQSPGTDSIGPDGCLYYTISGSPTGSLVKIGGPGLCGGSPPAEITLTSSATSSPAGSPVTLTAQLSNFASAGGTPVRFAISGPNVGLSLSHADGTGKATFSYSGVFRGIDTITASAIASGHVVSSAPVQIQWTSGKDTTFLDLNASQLGGAFGLPATITASLWDVSHIPATPVGGQTVTLGLAGQKCEAETNGSGLASCKVAPLALGVLQTTATYAGNAQYTPSQAANTFETTLGVPVNVVPPAISGTPTPGHGLSCAAGMWSGAPTNFKYQWNRSGHPIVGATRSTYTVQIPDEAQTLTCTVAASNAIGTGLPATSQGVLVALPGTLLCPQPSGRLSGASLGRLKLGFTRTRARLTLTRFGVTYNNMDDFCLFAGWGIRAGYPSSKLLHSLGRGLRARVTGRVILLLTANPFYALRGVKPGSNMSGAISRLLHLGKRLRVGANDWYLAPGKTSAGVLKVQHGVIQEVGVADGRLLHGRGAQRRFLTSFTRAKP